MANQDHKPEVVPKTREEVANLDLQAEAEEEEAREEANFEA